MIISLHIRNIRHSLTHIITVYMIRMIAHKNDSQTIIGVGENDDRQLGYIIVTSRRKENNNVGDFTKGHRCICVQPCTIS